MDISRNGAMTCLFVCVVSWHGKRGCKIPLQEFLLSIPRRRNLPPPRRDVPDVFEHADHRFLRHVIRRSRASFRTDGASLRLFPASSLVPPPLHGLFSPGISTPFLRRSWVRIQDPSHDPFGFRCPFCWDVSFRLNPNRSGSHPFRTRTLRSLPNRRTCASATRRVHLPLPSHRSREGEGRPPFPVAPHPLGGGSTW